MTQAPCCAETTAMSTPAQRQRRPVAAKPNEQQLAIEERLRLAAFPTRATRAPVENICGGTL